MLPDWHVLQVKLQKSPYRPAMQPIHLAEYRAHVLSLQNALGHGWSQLKPLYPVLHAENEFICFSFNYEIHFIIILVHDFWGSNKLLWTYENHCGIRDSQTC